MRAMRSLLLSLLVPGNIHSGVSGNDSIMATGVFSAHELLRITRRTTIHVSRSRTYLLTYLLIAFETCAGGGIATPNKSRLMQTDPHDAALRPVTHCVVY